MILVLFLGSVFKRWLMRGFETLAIQYLVYNSRKKVLLFLQTTEHKSKAESRQISCYAVISIQM